MMKTGYFFLILPFLFFTACEKRTRGFSLKKITSYYRQASSTQPQPKNLSTICNQPFTFLGSGNHTYAFVSEDNQYVIKFFKQKHMRTQEFFLPLKRKAQRKRLRNRTLLSYEIAFFELKEETGLIFLHLDKSPLFDIQLKIIDQNGTSYTLPANEYEFLIQKKAELAFRYIEKLLKKNQSNEALDAMMALLKLNHRRMEKGIDDRDIQFFKNFGFAEGKAIEIDVGEFTYDEKQKSALHQKKELKRLSSQLLFYVDHHAPELKSPLEKRLQDL
ncbi:MAG: hypothetical protein WDZ28_05515 [Simkaniaceae bacterium]